MNFITLVTILVLVGVNVASAQDNNDSNYISFYNKTVAHLLPNYRLPIESDMKHDWTLKGSYVYKTKDNEGKHKAPYWTKGLFNHDKIVDYAYILLNKKNQRKYLFAIVSTTNGYKSVLLEGAHDDEMGLATQDAGEFMTASGKGYWEPSKDDPALINLKWNAISYFAFESASSLFVWDETVGDFKRHWMSD